MPIQTEFSDEQLVSISIRSYSIDECVQAMAFCYFKIDELKTQMRSQANNRRRKYYEYMFGQIKKRMTKLEIQAERRATNKRLRRHETKAKSEVIEIFFSLATSMASMAMTSEAAKIAVGLVFNLKSSCAA